MDLNNVRGIKKSSLVIKGKKGAFTMRQFGSQGVSGGPARGGVRKERDFLSYKAAKSVWGGRGKRATSPKFSEKLTSGRSVRRSERSRATEKGGDRSMRQLGGRKNPSVL